MSEHATARQLPPLRPADSQGLFLSQRCGQITQGKFSSVLSSDGARRYSVAVLPEGSDCTCPGFKYHGRCKHVKSVADQICSWQLGQGQDQSLEQNVSCVCPQCQGPTEVLP